MLKVSGKVADISDIRLFVVVATRGSYDARFELDEYNLELKGDPIPAC